MDNRLYQFFTKDHRRIDDFLDKATENPDNIQMEYYNAFRTGLLRHIKMEEKFLFPAAKQGNGGVALPVTAQLRLEHGALTSLMVPPPSPALIKVLRHVLEKHDQVEEAPGGMYEACERLTGDRTDTLLEALSKVAEVPVHPHNEADYALGAAKRALERAGYDYDALAG